MSTNVLIGGAKLGCRNERMHAHFAQDRDGGWGILDSTVVRVHPSAAGAEKNGEQALGRSRVGFSCKIHVTVDALGNPVRTCLTARQRHDSTQARALLEGLGFAHVIADRGYVATDFLAYLEECGITAVIPPHQRAKVLREYDQHLYKERHLVECFMNKSKHFRRILSRFDKLNRAYLGFLHFVSVSIWLR